MRRLLTPRWWPSWRLRRGCGSARRLRGRRRAEGGKGFDGFEQLEPLFDHLEDMKNVEMLLWCINQSDAVRVDPALKAKVDALEWPTNLVPGTNTTKTCRYVEAAFLWAVETTHNTADN